VLTQTVTAPTVILPALKTLRSLPQWVCWRKIKRNGEYTKPPYNAYTGKEAASDDPSSWASYDRVQETFERSQGHYNGIGFMFNAKVVPITGIDLDHCIDASGNIEAWAQEIIDFLNSYAELGVCGW
jgi:primase-polymerase (primpol)-like protein